MQNVYSAAYLLLNFQHNRQGIAKRCVCSWDLEVVFWRYVLLNIHIELLLASLWLVLLWDPLLDLLWTPLHFELDLNLQLGCRSTPSAADLHFRPPGLATLPRRDAQPQKVDFLPA